MNATLDRRSINPWRLGGWTLAGLLLVAPLVAMQLTAEVNWGIGDFALAAILLGGAGLAVEAMLRLVRGTRARIGLALAIAAILMLVWAELAVGLFH